jgi:hypothetical protein
MPYIRPEQRQLFTALDTLTPPIDSGEMNYCITRLIHLYIHHNGRRYKQMNDVVGALECAKQEFLRRVVGPYEDEKIKENGDVP